MGREQVVQAARQGEPDQEAQAEQGQAVQPEPGQAARQAERPEHAEQEAQHEWKLAR